MSRRDLVLSVVLGLLCVAGAFPRATLGRESLVPTGALVGDPVFKDTFAKGAPERKVWDTSGMLVHYPAAVLAAAELRTGNVPLWNPYVGAGTPLLAEAHSAPLSPFLVPFWLAPSERSYTWFLLLRWVVAVSGAFLLARTMGTGRLAAALSAVTYGAGGLAAARFDLPTEGTAYAMLPLCTIAALLVVGRRPGGVALHALSVGVTLYSAHPELAALAALGSILIAGCTAGPDGRTWVRLFSGAALGVGLGGVVVVPLLSFLLDGGASYKTDAKLAGMFASDMIYFRAVPTFLRLGAVPLLLSCMAFFTGRAEAPTVMAARRAAWATVALAAALFAVQSLAPPPLGGLVPPRYSVFLVALAMALLSAHGMDALRAGRLEGRVAWKGAAVAALAWGGCDALAYLRLHRLPDVWVGEIVGAVLVVACLAWPRLRDGIGRALLVGATAVSLFVSASRTVAPSHQGSLSSPAAKAIGALPRAPARLAGLGAYPDRAAMTPNVATLVEMGDVRAVSAVFPVRYRRFMALVDGAKTQATWTLLNKVGSPLIDLLGVSHVVSRPDKAPSGWPIAWRGDGAVITKNPSALPRVLVPTDLRPAAGPVHAEELLRGIVGSERLAEVAVVEASESVLAGLKGGRARARIVEYHPSRVVIEAWAEAPSLIVLTDTWESGWHARVDGLPSPMYPTDLLFRGLGIRTGHHRIVMEYRPWGFRAGVLLTAGTSVALVVGTVVARWPARKRRTVG
ncbi:MAG: YfhO family protein [Deltaproteobacteria bacterium]|nr:YfhO family protein [Deltaproteobacteria bacterium]